MSVLKSVRIMLAVSMVVHPLVCIAQADDVRPAIAAAQAPSTAEDQLRDIVNTCKQRYVSHVVKTHAAEVSCARDQILPILDTAHYPDRDLVDMALAKRLVVAEQQDQHKLSAGQAAVQSAQIKIDLTQALEQRKAVRQQTGAMQAQARAQIAGVQQQRLSDQQRLAAQQAQAQADLQAQQEEARHERNFALIQQGLNMMAGPRYIAQQGGSTTMQCQYDGGGQSTCVPQ